MKQNICAVVLGVIAVWNGAAFALDRCSEFTTTVAQLNELNATSAGQVAFNVCGACGKAGYNIRGYTDSDGNKKFQYDCGSTPSSNGLYKIVRKGKIVSECGYVALFNYYDCEYAGGGDDGDYCDNDFYWNENGDCAACPEPPQNWSLVYDRGGPSEEFGDFTSTIGGAFNCGYGTRYSDSIGVTSCVLVAEDDCEYCDLTGCFELFDDCPYTN